MHGFFARNIVIIHSRLQELASSDMGHRVSESTQQLDGRLVINQQSAVSFYCNCASFCFTGTETSFRKSRIYIPCLFPNLPYAKATR
jgi:hypothetical protein